jgi:hypothetical protein
VIEEGASDGVDLNGLPVALVSRYSDDEERSPWTWVLYVSESASAEQREAIEGIYSGAFGGDALKHFPWAWKPSNLVAVRPAEIVVDHTPRRQLLRVRDEVSVRIRDRYPGPETVTCVIPGHETPGGEELIADELQVDSAPLAFEFAGVCGYASTFDYSG